MKKPKVKKRSPKSDQKKADKPVAPVPQDEKTEHPFDFGGLPDRDLKKNLGCG